MVDHEELEGVAREALDATATTAPVDAYALAAAVGLQVRPWAGPGAMLDRDASTVWLSSRPLRLVRQHGLVAHEVGHWLAGLHGLPDEEEVARYLAGALLVPRETLDRQLRAGWSIVRLRELHPHASAEMLARRVTQLRPAVATVLDGPRLHVRVASPWLDVGRVAAVTDLEADLVAQARLEGREVSADGPTVATPAGRSRVVVVARQWWATESGPS